MLKVEVWNKSVPRVELDQRARDARLQIERMERLLAPRTAMSTPWFRRVLCLFGFSEPSEGSRAGRIRGLPSDRRPPRPQYPRGWAPTAG